MPEGQSSMEEFDKLLEFLLVKGNRAVCRTATQGRRGETSRPAVPLSSESIPPVGTLETPCFSVFDFKPGACR